MIWQNDHELTRKDAHDFIHHIQDKCIKRNLDHKSLHRTLEHLISRYLLDSIVMGTRGQRSMIIVVIRLQRKYSPGDESVERETPVLTSLRGRRRRIYTVLRCLLELRETRSAL
ncbi:hypothetical protein C8R48DRAFT_369017 [Suillus tomentosus]|nr:hypothetical protein C8R48DRAFT_369017 [Suillus tomentosus]